MFDKATEETNQIRACQPFNTGHCFVFTAAFRLPVLCNNHLLLQHSPHAECMRLIHPWILHESIVQCTEKVSGNFSHVEAMLLDRPDG